MSLLSYNELCDLVDRGVIGPVEPDCINASSIDIHLGNTLIVERNCGEQFPVVDPFKRTNFPQDKVVISDGYHYDLARSGLILNISHNQVKLPGKCSSELNQTTAGSPAGRLAARAVQ